jgi:hypothetical protein
MTASCARSASPCSTVTCICFSSCGNAGSIGFSILSTSGWSSSCGDKAMPAAASAASMFRVA